MGKHFGELAFIRGIVYYKLSPHEQKPFAGAFTRGVLNVFQRTSATVLYWLPRKYCKNYLEVVRATGKFPSCTRLHLKFLNFCATFVFSRYKLQVHIHEKKDGRKQQIRSPYTCIFVCSCLLKLNVRSNSGYLSCTYRSLVGEAM